MTDKKICIACMFKERNDAFELLVRTNNLTVLAVLELCDKHYQQFTAMRGKKK